jgi:plastocyanin
MLFVMPPGAQGATATVDVEDSQFSPAMINIQAGDTVDWEFVGSTNHNVTAADNSFASATMTSGTFSRTFNTGGTFAYFCTIHGTIQGQGMAGTVVVADAATPTNTAQAAAPSATRTATRTPEATDTPSTPTATSTPAPGASATPVEVVPISAPVEDLPATTGGAAPSAVGAPSTGTGPDGATTRTYVVAIVLAVSGAGSVGGALVLARRRLRD